MNNEQNTQAGAAVLTEKQIAAGAIVRCDHGGSIGRSAAIEVFDAMRAVAPIAAQAGQVAVPEGWTVERAGEAIHIKRADGRWCGYMPEISPAAALTFEFLGAMLAAAPAAPAQAKPLPTPVEYKPVGQFLFTGWAYEATSSDDPRGITLYRPAQASTADVRSQEGGDRG